MERYSAVKQQSCYSYQTYTRTVEQLWPFVDTIDCAVLPSVISARHEMKIEVRCHYYLNALLNLSCCVS